ncbi:Alkaline phosphatase synthesis transcriptional regulatory protein PhoP [Novipirellula aureliae]|uniref:Alkaline phosphatase synthesis transcriptional regulatory protein PhoP n=1 Tax=Novipirellula aureliae TaxID=2527966 RepID=A0A5C6E8B9_9BACT|nr:response regulator transcription factor [Novipirellula aureliae]TWU43716.1 Alkaline phosphatase synthesis transcriptional regulatory protein PhoP [Novipirellula aureliae]
MTERLTILTIEDDSAIRCGIVDALQFSGYNTIESGDGPSGKQQAIQCTYDLLLLDLGLPGLSGMEILRSVRKLRLAKPVIVLTAKGEEADRVQGLREGADDYVVKPFSIKELVARVEAVLRRSTEMSKLAPIHFAHGVIDFDRRELRYRDGMRSELSERETLLLKYLVANLGRAISRDELLTNVWQLTPKGISTRTIDMHIARLREKLRDNTDPPSIILTVRGTGYMWTAHSLEAKQ